MTLKKAWMLLFLLPMAGMGCLARQAYLRGYSIGYDRADDACREVKMFNTHMCEDELNEVQANLRICQGILGICQFNTREAEKVKK